MTASVPAPFYAEMVPSSVSNKKILAALVPEAVTLKSLAFGSVLKTVPAGVACVNGLLAALGILTTRPAFTPWPS